MHELFVHLYRKYQDSRIKFKVSCEQGLIKIEPSSKGLRQDLNFDFFYARYDWDSKAKKNVLMVGFVKADPKFSSPFIDATLQQAELAGTFHHPTKKNRRCYFFSSHKIKEMDAKNDRLYCQAVLKALELSTGSADGVFTQYIDQVLTPAPVSLVKSKL